MSVSDGEKISASVSNAAWMSRKVDTSTVGEVDLNSPSTASGSQISNSQREHNSIASFTGKSVNTSKTDVPTWTSDVIGTANQPIKNRVDSVQASLETNNTETTDLRTLTGTSVNDTDLGTFTGTIITDNTDIKTALQEIETALEPITDGLDLQGSWNANTNSPTLTSGVGTKGHFYVVSVAGSTNLDGITDWQIGDWAIFDGTVWFKADNSSPVASVFGRTGAVVAQSNDYTWNQIDKTVSTIDDIADVETTGVTDGQVLTYVTANSRWEAATPSGGGGGSGEGRINYIVNPDAETSTSDTAVTANVSVIRQTTGQHRGTGSFDVTFDSAAVAGNHFEMDLSTVDAQDLGKKMFVCCDFSDDGNFAVGDLELVLRDVTGAVDLPVTLNTGLGNEIKPTGSLTSRTRVTGSVVLDPTNDDYKLRFQVKSSPAATSIIRLDRVIVGPDTPVPGVILDEFESFVPTGTWSTNTTYTGFKRRVGDTLEVEIEIDLAGAPDATSLRVDLPTGLTIDTAKLANDTGDRQSIVGQVAFTDADGSDYIGHCRVHNSTEIRIISISASANHADTSNTSPFTFASGDAIGINFKVPISGWSAGASISSTEAVFETVRSKMILGGAASHSTSSTSEVVPLAGTEFDPQGIANTSTNKIVIPAPGYYLLNGSVGFTANATGHRSAQIFLNGTTVVAESVNTANGGGFQDVDNCSTIKFLDKDDEIQLRAFQDSGGALAYRNLDDETFLEVQSLPDFSIFSVTGETEYKEVVLATDFLTSSLAADTFSDVTGMSLSLTAGVWDIGYSAAMRIQKLTSSGLMTGQIAILDSGNSPYDTSLGFIQNNSLAINEINGSQVSTVSRITLASNETIKLSVRKDVGTADGDIRVLSTAGPGTWTDPEYTTILWARRVN